MLFIFTISKLEQMISIFYLFIRMLVLCWPFSKSQMAHCYDSLSHKQLRLTLKVFILVLRQN